MATHSRVLAWRIPWTEEPGGLHTVHSIAKSQTGLKGFSLHLHHALTVHRQTLSGGERPQGCGSG